MEIICCFCGEVIKKDPHYILTLHKNCSDKKSELPSQDLWCHEKCLEKKLFDEKMLYLKYVECD